MSGGDVVKTRPTCARSPEFHYAPIKAGKRGDNYISTGAKNSESPAGATADTERTGEKLGACEEGKVGMKERREDERGKGLKKME